MTFYHGAWFQSLTHLAPKSLSLNRLAQVMQSVLQGIEPLDALRPFSSCMPLKLHTGSTLKTIQKEFFRLCQTMMAPKLSWSPPQMGLAITFTACGFLHPAGSLISSQFLYLGIGRTNIEAR